MSTKHRKKAASAVDQAFSIPPERIVGFLAELATAKNPTDWLRRLRDFLVRLCDDVDRIVLQVNADCVPACLHVPPEILHLVQKNHEHDDFRSACTLGEQSCLSAEALLRSIERAGDFCEEYHDPVVFTYDYWSGSYLGAMLLFRERTRPPIGAQTCGLVADLDPFMRFLLASFVARQAVVDRRGHAFATALATMYDDYALTLNELSVLTLQWMGLSVDRIAERLSLSESVVGEHVESIHRRTGCDTFTEIFGRYLSSAVEEERKERQVGKGMVLVF